MPETRRELFQTSVTAALGLAVGAIAGYAVSGGFSQPRISTTPLTGAAIAVYDTSGYWYFFIFDGSDPSKCQLWRTNNTGYVPSSSPLSATNVVDTLSWFTSLKSKGEVSLRTEATTINYLPDTGPAVSLSIQLDGSNNLQSQSLQNLLHVLGGNLHQIPGSWNEIGKQ